MPITCFTKLKINEASVRVNRMQLDLDAIANFKTLSRAIQLGHRVSRALETERKKNEAILKRGAKGTIGQGPRRLGVPCAAETRIQRAQSWCRTNHRGLACYPTVREEGDHTKANTRRATVYSCVLSGGPGPLESTLRSGRDAGDLGIHCRRRGD